MTQLSNITVCDDSVTWQWGRDSGGGGGGVGLRMSVGACCGSHQNFTVGAERRC